MIKTPPRGEYQKEAVAAALEHDGFLITCEQRTGKCWIALNIIDARKPRHLWIVCPIQAFKTWKTQIAEHLQVDWECQFMMINYEEMLANKKSYYKLAKKIKHEGLMIVADEVHRIKRRGSGISRTLRQLKKYAKYRLGLTGTPIGNCLQDAWAQIDFADPKVFGPWSDKIHKKTKEILRVGFESRYLIYGGFGGFKVVGYNHEKELRKKIDSRSYRVTLREARGKDRPLKLKFERIFVNMNSSSWDLYRELEEELIVEVNKKKVSVPVVVALSMKLQQICGGFIIDTEEKEVHKIGMSKTNRLLRYALERKRLGQKFLIVCRFIHEIDHLQEELFYADISSKRVIGGEPYDHKFDTDCIILQVQSGVAVDMSPADYTIFYSWDYSYINYEQVKFRVLDFTKPFASFSFLIVRDSIDELIYEAVKRKKKLAHLVLDKYRKRKHDRKSRIQPGRRRVRDGRGRD